MSLSSLVLLHMMAGAGVAVAVFLASPSGQPWHRAFLVISAVLFWPLYVPLLLAPATTPGAGPSPPEPAPPPPADALAQAIALADAELESALQSLDGWAEHVLAREKDRLRELRQAWLVQADRVRAMDRLLSRPGVENDPAVDARLALAPAALDRFRLSQQVIQQNLGRLKQVRQRTLDDLLGTLAWVRELASMIHLAKFTGAPASRAEELVAQIAASVEGLSELTWREPGGDKLQLATDVR